MAQSTTSVPTVTGAAAVPEQVVRTGSAPVVATGTTEKPRRPRRFRLFTTFAVVGLAAVAVGGALATRALVTSDRSMLSVVDQPLDVVPGVTDPHAGPRLHRAAVAEGADVLAAKHAAAGRASVALPSTGAGTSTTHPAATDDVVAAKRAAAAAERSSSASVASGLADDRADVAAAKAAGRHA
ncbi:MAG: hypothetical protein U0R68_15575 [Candidatus Nanopelagicales bacterium]